MAYLNSRPRTPKVCPICGETVPPKSLACPECGSDHNTGWKKDAQHEVGLDLPEEEFDYQEFVNREFGTEPIRRSTGLSPLWWITGVILLIAFMVMFFSGVFWTG